MAGAPGQAAAPPKPSSALPNWVLAGLLGAFIGATYYRTISNVSSDDLEKEFERELAEEDQRQRRAQAAEQQQKRK